MTAGRKGDGRVRRTLAACIAVAAVVMAALPARTLAIEPEDVFQTGHRAFLLGHWNEAVDAFSRFLDRWPGHPACAEAVLYRLLGESRSGFDRVRRDYDERRVASLTAGMAFVRQKLPDADLTELEVELDCARMRLDPSASLASSVANLSPDRLAHLLNRNILPAPAADPRGTLDWIAGWKAKHGGTASETIRASLELRKAKALWQIVLSPLPAARMEERLKKDGDFPAAQALVRSLRKAYGTGDPDTKREAALLGVCAANLPAVARYARSDLRAWEIYLGDRGNFRDEAWCPR